ncbi:methylenetetrahydrofolate reductase C-terminal domain-containing protein [Geosporobacter ferrireducens]|uniref:methylenetetrahydrofolate reductase C-terminal domain-containing protein n=1 Tax=Geosporobacter ferrireducens TaxID=1424294 RepID=UPI00139D5618|nr:methylenetetrahydrofolate reductase C-terminal domain-containing protein [Geosporobacter ferrireducens]MTI57030.1 methylenetetrahydrofolate reductase [Geosporobacter ferrireducens]
MSTEKLSFRDALYEPEKFAVVWELVPGRGAWEQSQDQVLKMAELAAKDSRINGITITDNPSGKPAILPYPLAMEAKKLGIETLIHFTCKDKNRNDIESELHALARSELKNLLVMTGDYTTEGFSGRPKPVFDLDAVHTLRMIEKMNQGLEIHGHKGKIKLQATEFFGGAVVSPFKLKEGEVMAQYYKLHKKIANGAKFIITQLGYDARKFDELRKYMDLNNFNIPLLGNIFVLSLPVAKLMNKNKIPGCVVTDEMMFPLHNEKQKYGNSKEPQLLRAAKLYALLKGLKYDGVTIAGHGLEYSDIQYILDKGEELAPNWMKLIAEFNYPQRDGFYFFEKDETTELNTNNPVDRTKTGSAKSSILDAMFNMVHKVGFNQKSSLFPVIRTTARVIDKTFLKKPFTYFEYMTKTITNECCFCGDCAMHELAFQCPMSQCAKQQRNGACGGSRDGWCEVYPEKQKCIYVTMYEKFKAAGKEESMKKGYIPPCNWDLYRTSSWLNYFNDRDYNSKTKENE